MLLLLCSRLVVAGDDSGTKAPQYRRRSDVLKLRLPLSNSNTRSTSPWITDGVTVDKRAIPVLPPGWSYISCISDSSTSRTLPNQIYPTGLMTIDKCLAGCVSSGYKYGGLEFGKECFCGNKISSGNILPPSNCRMACEGDSSQTCGGTSALTLYGKSAMVYQSLGCYTDASSPRTLDVSSSSDNMTPTLCQSLCEAQALTYSGTEAGRECWCSNTAPTVRGTKVTDSQCSTTCSGDSSQTCGGSYRLSIYGTQSSPTTTTTTTTTTTASGTPVATYAPMGCYTDSVNRTLEYQTPSSNRMTTELCQSRCASQRMTYAGTEYGVRILHLQCVVQRSLIVTVTFHAKEIDLKHAVLVTGLISMVHLRQALQGQQRRQQQQQPAQRDLATPPWGAIPTQQLVHSSLKSRPPMQ
ncbi:hypothetical protein FRC02_001157 [Tulasnella sp. 418]|nr:hypothetical protein FRC02_001157 [Tulasnella sp. 418]